MKLNNEANLLKYFIYGKYFVFFLYDSKEKAGLT